MTGSSILLLENKEDKIMVFNFGKNDVLFFSEGSRSAFEGTVIKNFGDLRRLTHKLQEFMITNFVLDGEFYYEMYDDMVTIWCKASFKRGYENHLVAVMPVTQWRECRWDGYSDTVQIFMDDDYEFKFPEWLEEIMEKK